MENKRYKQRRIIEEIEQTVYDRYVMPHMAMVPDYFLRYWDLAELIYDHFDIPFTKLKLTEPEEFEALKVKIDKTDTNSD